MAELISASGKIVSVSPDPSIGYFTMKTIYNFLKDVVEPIFVGTKWMFICKRGQSLNYPINLRASEMVGFYVYGDVIVAEDYELSKSFFIPDDLKDEIIKSVNNMQNQYLKEIKSKNKKPKKKNKPFENNDEDEEENAFLDHLTEKERNTEIIMRNTYNSLFEMGFSFEDIMKNFYIFIDETNEIFEIDETLESRLKVLNGLLNYYSEKEEYEKCINIKKFINKMYNYYQLKQEK